MDKMDAEIDLKNEDEIKVQIVQSVEPGLIQSPSEAVNAEPVIASCSVDESSAAKKMLLPLRLAYAASGILLIFNFIALFAGINVIVGVAVMVMTSLTHDIFLGFSIWASVLVFFWLGSFGLLYSGWVNLIFSNPTNLTKFALGLTGYAILFGNVFLSWKKNRDLGTIQKLRHLSLVVISTLILLPFPAIQMINSLVNRSNANSKSNLDYRALPLAFFFAVPLASYCTLSLPVVQ